MSSVDIINSLIKAGADVTQKCREGFSSIHYMATKINYRVLSTFLNAGIDINTKSSSGFTIFDTIMKVNSKMCSFFL